MRHAVFGWRLSRDTNARRALLSSLASSVLEKGQITTTLPKAKFAKSYLEKLITIAKKNRLNNKRLVASDISPGAFKRLNDEIAPGFKARPGGYSRIIKLNKRQGDGAQIARLELLKWEKVEPVAKKKGEKTVVSKATEKKPKEKETRSRLTKKLSAIGKVTKSKK